MGLLDSWDTVVREYLLREGRREVAEAIAHLKATRKDLGIVAADREWLVPFVVERPDQRWRVPEVQTVLSSLLFQASVPERVVCQWIEEALSNVAPRALPDLPACPEGAVWCAVLVDGNLYCCACRSLFEGTPLTEGQVSTLAEEGSTYCSECDIDL